MHRLGRPHRASPAAAGWRPVDATRDSDRSGAAGLRRHARVPAQPAAAQQTLNFSLGYFTVRGEDARVDGDVLNENRNVPRLRRRAISTARPSAASGWCRWANTSRRAPGVELLRDARCRRCTQISSTRTAPRSSRTSACGSIPVAFTVRVLPLGQTSPVQPYFGGGLGICSAWRYSESGEFVDFRGRTRSSATSSSPSGTATGPVVLGGIRFAGDAVSAGGEVRYHSADARSGTALLDRPGESADRSRRLDLQFTIGWRFGGQ